MCATVAPHTASALTDYVLAGFDRDYAIMHQAAISDPSGFTNHGVDPVHQHLVEEHGWPRNEIIDGDPGYFEDYHNGEHEDLDDPHVHEGRLHQAQEEGLAVEELLPWLSGGGNKDDDGGDGGDDDEPGMAETPKVAALHLSQGDPYGHLTLLPGGKHEDEEDEEEEKGKPDPSDPQFPRNNISDQPKMGETPGTDPNLGQGYYSIFGPGGQMNKAAGITIDRYGHISLGTGWYPHPHPEAEDPDPDQEISEAENRDPEADIYHGHDEPEYEADWERPSERGRPDYGNWAGGARERKPRTSARREEKGTVPCPICHKKFEPDELAEHMKQVHHVSEGEEKDEEYKNRVPGRAKPGQNKAKPNAGRQTHKPSRGQSKSPAKEGQLARSPQRPLEGHWRPGAYESGYDPSEAFPGYYGDAQGPQRPRTAQAPLAGQSDVPSIGGPGSAPNTPTVTSPPVSTPESGTGASGMFTPGGGGGAAGGDFSQTDAPQDMQSQLGQLPALSHKVGAKLAEMAAEAISYNPGLSALAAMELSLQVMRLYPKVAAGGSDYTAEPGSEGVPTEVLTECPQCQWQAYNRQINRCHNCGFYDAAAEPAIELT